MTRHAFRLRFVLSDLKRLPYEGDEQVLHEDAETVIYLRAGGAINTADHVALVGKSFDTEAAAIAAGEQWRTRIERSFACLGIGVDFGDLAPACGLTEAGLALMQDATGVVYMNDVHGLMTFDATGKHCPSGEVLTAKHCRSLRFRTRPPQRESRSTAD